ncbi:MAG: AAA family ATPase [Bacillota bacterium]
MKLINRKYKIVKSLELSNNFTSYLVYDISHQDSLLELTIIEANEKIEKQLINFARKYQKLKSLNVAGILKDVEWDIVTSIDGKKAERKLFYIVCEYIENNINLKQLSAVLNRTEKVRLFIDLCNSLHLLHLSDYTYKHINPSTIALNSIDSGYTARLRSLGFKELLCIAISGHCEDDAVENFEDNKKKDMYSLGIFLLNIFGMDISEFDNFGGQAQNNADEEISFEQKIALIAAKMCCYVEDEYDSLDEVVKAISRSILARPEIQCRSKYMQSMKQTAALIGREQEMRVFEGLFEKDSNVFKGRKIFFVHGEKGIGKTLLLKNIIDFMKIKGINVFYSMDLENEIDTGDKKAFIKMLKSIISVSDKHIVEEYMKDIVKFLPELGINRPDFVSRVSDEYVSNEDLLKRIIEFAVKTVKNAPAVYVFDNIDYADDLSIGVLEILLRNEVLGESKACIISYTDDAVYRSSKLYSLLESERQNPLVYEIELRGLSGEDTKKLVRELVSKEIDANRISNRLYEKSKGNPLYIQEVIRSLYLNSVIHIDSKNGKWVLEEEWESSNIPVNIEQVMQSIINGLDDEEKDLLGIISVFNIPVPISLLKTLFDINELESVLSMLVKKGIIYEISYEGTISYKHANSLLKKLIYERIEDTSKRLIHNIASQVLEKLANDNRSLYIHELHYHLEKADAKQRGIHHYLQNAELMDKYNNHREVIYCLEKALELYEHGPKEKANEELIFKLGKKYRITGEYIKALDCFEKIYHGVRKLGKKEFYIDLIEEIVKVLIILADFKRAKSYIRIAKKYLEKFDYLTGLLKILWAEASIYRNEGEYDKALEVATKILPMCTDEHLCIKGMTYNIMGIAYRRTGRYKESLDSYAAAVKCLESIDTVDINLMGSILMNTSLAYGNYGDLEKKNEYMLKAKTVIEKCGEYKGKFISYLNIGAWYCESGMYELGIDSFNKVFKKAKQLGMNNEYFISVVNTMIVNIRLFNYAEAARYMSIGLNELEAYPPGEALTNDFYYCIMTYYFEMGQFKRANNFLRKIDKADDADISISEVKQIISILIDAVKNKTINEKQVEEIITLLQSGFHTEELIFIPARISMLLLDLGWEDEALAILAAVNTDKIKVDEESIVTFIKRYVILSKSKDIKGLVNLWERAKGKGYYYIASKVGFKIASFYYRQPEPYKAFYCYIEGYCDFYRLLSSVEYEYRIDFTKLHGFMGHIENFRKLMNSLFGKSRSLSKKTRCFEDFNMLSDINCIRSISKDQQLLEAARALKKISCPVYESLDELIINLGSDAFLNLESICCYLEYRLLCSRALIIFQKDHGSEAVIAPGRDNGSKGYNNELYSLAQKMNKPIIFNKEDYSEDKFSHLYHNSHFKAAACIPVILNSGKKSEDTGKVLGYIYMEAYNSINLLSEDNIYHIEKISKLAALNLEKLLKDTDTSISMTHSEREYKNKPYGINEGLDGLINDRYEVDQKKLGTLLRVLEILRRQLSNSDKLIQIIDILIEELDAEYAAVFQVDKGKPIEMFVEKHSKYINDDIKYNTKVLESVIMNKQGVCLIDWDMIGGYGKTTGIPYWNSLILNPVIQNEEIVYILYIAVSNDIKEFTEKDLDFVKVISNIICAL